MGSKLSILAFSLFLSTSVFAADFYVRDQGAGGAYPTITAAIAAATDGDRIIVRPKTGNLPYIESFTIDKSLTFVSEINFTKYLVQGTVLLNPAAGRTITIHNLSITGNVSKNAVIPVISGGRCAVNLMNSIVTGNVDMNASYTSLNMSGCTVTQEVIFLHGKICGNVLKRVYTFGDYPDNLATSPIYIIANKLSELTLQSNTYAFRILNNYLDTTSNLNTTSMRIFAIKPGSDNFITNNTIINTLISDSNTTLINITDVTNAGVISVKNNILRIAANGSLPSIRKSGNTTLAVYADYNMSATNLSFSGTIIASNNSSNSSVSVNDTTGITSGDAIDAGDPADEYSDLNLTVNDIGTGGGSDNWINYWPGEGNKPQVFFLDVPPRIYQGTTTLQVQANGYSK